MRGMRLAQTAIASVAVAAAAAGIGLVASGAGPTTPAPASFTGDPAVPCERPPIAWQDSKAVGKPFRRGRLVRGVQLPEDGDDFFTWDFPLRVSPNRWWRRWGADGTIRITLQVLCDFHLAHPDAPRIGIADIARPFGGKFGKRFGGEGHASHQNGLDIDVLYPRLDRLEAAPTRVAQIDRVLAQELVDRFVAAGARALYVGPRTGLRGPRRIVVPLVHHDDHVHVRFPRLLGAPPGPPPIDPAPPA